MTELGRLLPPGAVDLVPCPVSEAEFSLLDDVFEAIPANMLETLPLVGDTIIPLPPGREEVLYFIGAVPLPVGVLLNVVALLPPIVGLPRPFPMLVTDGIPTPALLSVEFGVAGIALAEGHTVGPRAP